MVFITAQLLLLQTPSDDDKLSPSQRLAYACDDEKRGRAALRYMHLVRVTGNSAAKSQCKELPLHVALYKT
jgi:hypothetical protein